MGSLARSVWSVRRAVRIVEMLLTDDAWWRIGRDDPALHELQALPGWSFINPLVYPAVADTGHYRLDALVDDTVLIETNVLAFQTAGEDEEFLRLSDFTSRLMAHLRYLSKQAELGRALFGGGHSSPRPRVVPSPLFPAAKPDNSQWVMNYRVNTAITWAQVQQADAAMLRGEPPLAAGVLLDAVLASMDHDDRRTILYAAMAVEILATTKLQVTRTPRGAVAYLFDHQPLKVLGRSLRQEDPSLYAQIGRLYRTRNHIAHGGMAPVRPDLLPPRGEGAYLALECANAVFRWFGELGDYVPAHGGVPALVPEGWVLEVRGYPGILPGPYW